MSVTVASSADTACPALPVSSSVMELMSWPLPVITGASLAGLTVIAAVPVAVERTFSPPVLPLTVR